MRYRVKYKTYFGFGHGILEDIIEADNIAEAFKKAVEASKEIELANDITSIKPICEKTE